MPTAEPKSDRSRVIISVRRASKIYRMGEVDVHALREASIEIMDGERMIVVGPSGSGKSTLLNLIGGMDRPTSGQVLVRENGAGAGINSSQLWGLFNSAAANDDAAQDGEDRFADLAQASDRALTQYRRLQVGFVFQFYNLVPTLTALENVQVATEIVREPMAPEEALELVGMGARRDHFPAQLSGGEQQRVAIARALASNPRLLLCDEPTGALDLDTSRQVLGLLSELNERLGKTIVIITHNAAIAAIGHRVAHLSDGAITHIETVERRTPIEEISW